MYPVKKGKWLTQCARRFSGKTFPIDTQNRKIGMQNHLKTLGARKRKYLNRVAMYLLYIMPAFVYLYMICQTVFVVLSLNMATSMRLFGCRHRLCVLLTDRIRLSNSAFSDYKCMHIFRRFGVDQHPISLSF